MITLLLTLGMALQGPPSRGDAELRDRIAARLDELRDVHGYPGLAVGVVHGDGEPLFVVRGVRDRPDRPATSETLYQIGSVTKMLTGLLAARLHEEGVVDLDSRLAQVFPELELPPRVAELSLRQLASHTSGLARYPANLDRIDGDPILGYDRAELEAALESAGLRFEAGTDWSYSNFGYGVLGAALERVAGEELPELLRALVLAPAGIDDVMLDVSDPDARRLATPYRDDDPARPTRPWDMGELTAAGGAFASIEGLAQLARLEWGAFDDVDPVLGRARASAQTMHWSFEPGRPNGYGLGRFLIDSRGIGAYLSWHGGDVDGYAATLMVAPRERVAVAVLTNCGIGEPVGELGNWLMQEALQEFCQR